MRFSSPRRGPRVVGGEMTLIRSRLVVLMIAVCHTSQTTADDGPTLRVMSFNIRYGTADDGPNHWDHRQELVVETIRTFAPDLLGTQEVLGFQRDYLAGQLPAYAVVGVGRDDGHEQGEMAAVYFLRDRFALVDQGHFWLSEQPNVAGSKSWDSALPRMVTRVKLRDRRNSMSPPICVLNTHFDHRGVTARLKSAQRLRMTINQWAPDCSVIVLGDFNAAVDSLPYQVLFAANAGQPACLIDTYRRTHPEVGDDEGTFHGFHATVTQGERIDWIGVSSDWSIVDAGIDRTVRDGRTPSDHFPVTAVIRQTRDGR